MNKIVNKSSLAGDKFMPEMHLRQPELTYSACRGFTKRKERTQKFKEMGDSWYIYLVFNMTRFMEILKIKLKEQPLIKHYVIKHLILLKIQNIMDIEEGLLQWVYKFFNKKTSGNSIKNEDRIFQTKS